MEHTQLVELSVRIVFGIVLFGMLVIIVMCFVPTDRKNVEYWAQVHANNQEKLRRDQRDAFLARLEIPLQYRPKRSGDMPAPAKPLRAVDMTKGAPRRPSEGEDHP